MQETNAMQKLLSRLHALGISQRFARGLLPDWWDDSIAQDSAGLLQAQMIIANSLNLDMSSVRDDGAKIQFRKAVRKFKHTKGLEQESFRLSAEFATGLAKLAVQASSDKYVPPPSDPVEIRESICSKDQQVDLKSLLAYCTGIGIPVLHVGNLPGKKMHALAVKQNGRSAIVLCRNEKSPYLLFHLAHELGHIANGHLGNDGTLIDATIKSDGDKDESQADKFAIKLLNGSDVRYTSSGRFLTGEALAKAAVELGKEKAIDPGHIVLNYAKSVNNFAVANTALRYLPGNQVGAQVVNEHLAATLDKEKLSDDQYSLLQRSLTALE